MDKYFLDTNCLIDLVEERDLSYSNFLEDKNLSISALSIHILTYVVKHRVPHKNLNMIDESFNITSVDRKISLRAMEGPTSDFEDNTQLHCAAECGASVFLTNDKKLLNLAFFGKMKIISPKKLVKLD